MDLISLVGEFFASAFAWIVETTSSIWAAALQTSLMQGLTAVLGSGLAKVLLASAILLLVATALHVLGVIDDGTFKFFVAVFLLVSAAAIVASFMAERYWVALGIAFLAVLVLAACAAADPSLTAMVNEVLNDATDILGSVVSTVVEGVVGATANILPVVLTCIGVYALFKVVSSDGRNVKEVNFNESATQQ